jgi:hypothetical protein
LYRPAYQMGPAVSSRTRPPPHVPLPAECYHDPEQTHCRGHAHTRRDRIAYWDTSIPQQLRRLFYQSLNWVRPVTRSLTHDFEWRKSPMAFERKKPNFVCVCAYLSAHWYEGVYCRDTGFLRVVPSHKNDKHDQKKKKKKKYDTKRQKMSPNHIDDIKCR